MGDYDRHAACNYRTGSQAYWEDETVEDLREKGQVGMVVLDECANMTCGVSNMVKVQVVIQVSPSLCSQEDSE